MVRVVSALGERGVHTVVEGGIGLICLAHVAYHHLGLGNMSQNRDAPGFFYLFHDTVAVADALEGNRCLAWQEGEEVAISTWIVIHAGLLE